MAKKGLGRGLGALLDTNAVVETTTETERDVKKIKITQIEPNKTQPRNVFDEEKIEELADSIREYGIIQPIVVKLNKNGFYTIIAGERRWRAARLAGLKEVPALIKEVSEQTEKEITLIENIQREDLNALEEAAGIKELIDVYGLTQDEVAKKIGRSRPAVANILRLLNLPEEIQKLVKDNILSQGHARALLAVEDKEKAQEIAKLIIAQDMSVRQTESYISSLSKVKTVKKPTKEEIEISRHIKALEESLSSEFGTKIKIVNKKNKGRIEIPYSSAEDFDRIIALIKKK
ncbi:MAG: ParB/RepB/Spo0J family partition protein [Clostridia bacterium]|nr:ParB/RepB/Spo0J family partition protein [Clostridia bacterium]